MAIKNNGKNNLKSGARNKANRFYILWTSQVVLFLLGSTLYPYTAKAEMIFNLEEIEVYRVYLGSKRYVTAVSLQNGSYELGTEDGTTVVQDFREWYAPTYPELNFLFTYPLNDQISVVWGISTGSKGKKFKIDPGIWIGARYAHELVNNVYLQISGITLLGGDLRERSCFADWGSAAEHEVNCRLANEILPPSETLQYMVRQRGYIETNFQLALLWVF